VARSSTLATSRHRGWKMWILIDFGFVTRGNLGDWYEFNSAPQSVLEQANSSERIDVFLGPTLSLRAPNA
jgi:hypothetical protein